LQKRKAAIERLAKKYERSVSAKVKNDDKKLTRKQKRQVTIKKMAKHYEQKMAKENGVETARTPRKQIRAWAKLRASRNLKKLTKRLVAVKSRKQNGTLKSAANADAYMMEAKHHSVPKLSKKHAEDSAFKSLPSLKSLRKQADSQVAMDKTTLAAEKLVGELLE